MKCFRIYVAVMDERDELMVVLKREDITAVLKVLREHKDGSPKIPAIRELKRLTGLGLSESKWIVDKLFENAQLMKEMYGAAYA